MLFKGIAIKTSYVTTSIEEKSVACRRNFLQQLVSYTHFFSQIHDDDDCLHRSSEIILREEFDLAGYIMYCIPKRPQPCACISTNNIEN
jgi:hypothetical protein